MEREYTYTCPRCLTKCTINESRVGENLTCSNCALQFVASPPLTKLGEQSLQATSPAFQRPSKLPFFKSGRRRILEQELRKVIARNEFVDDAGEKHLENVAVALRLSKAEAGNLLTTRFTAEIEAIKRRMESSFVMTDDDVAEIDVLKRKYNVRLTLDANTSLFRAIYLLEMKRKLPAPVPVDLMLDGGEVCYYFIATTWYQSRVQTRAYSGTSISLPSGMRGVRFRFGGYTPVRSEQMTPLAQGTLYVTSKRLLFAGDSRNATVALKKIVGGHIFTDCVRIEKNTGKPDLFSMDAARARYILSLIDVLKEA